MFSQFSDLAHGDVIEVGAGIGTFSERLLSSGIESLLLLEPDRACVGELTQRLGRREEVQIAAETLPGSAALRATRRNADFVLCQNVLEHIADDGAALAEMAESLRPGGHFLLLVPAHPRLFGSLDEQYGHYRRYTRNRLLNLAAAADLEVLDLYSFNLLGVPGWWLKNRMGAAKLGRNSLAAYEAFVRLWRPLEDRFRPRWGLSLILRARRPE